MADLTHLVVGDSVAVERNERSYNGFRPKITYDILMIYRVTPKQIKTRLSIFSRETGRKQGGYSTAIEAAPEIMDQVDRERLDIERWMAASKKIDLYETAVRRNEMTLEQLESVAEALVNILGDKK